MHLRRFLGFATSPEQVTACDCDCEKLYTQVWSGLAFLPALPEAPLSTCCPVPALLPGLPTDSHGKGNFSSHSVSLGNMHQGGYESPTESHIISG